MPAQGKPMDVNVIALTLFPCLHWLDGLPLLALWEKQQQQEAMAAAHPVGEAQGEGLHLRQRLQLLELPLPHGRVPALREVPLSLFPPVSLLQGWGNRPRASVIPPHPLTEFSETSA